MRKIVIVIFLICTCLINISCKYDNTKKYQHDKVIVNNINVDNYYVKGINRQVFFKVPQRVVVIGENEIETLLELGLEKNILMAVAQNKREYDMRPYNEEKFSNISKCSSRNLNMEYIYKLKPDLIVAQQCIFVRNRLNNTEYWNSRGINTLIPLNTNSPSKHVVSESIDKEMQFIQDLGKAFQVHDRAKLIIDNTYKIINKINYKNKKYKKPKVMVIEFLNSIICYDKTKLIGDMITSIGGEISNNSAVISWENIIKENPDILFVVCSHREYGACINNVKNNLALRNLHCVKEKRIYSVPLRFTYGTGCRTEDGIKFIAEKMYPGIEL